MLPSLIAALLLAAPIASPPPPVTFETLLNEMTDRAAVARWPDPEYTCKQFSSYDRASTSPDKPETWFANGDSNHYLRLEDVHARGNVAAHKEWVMADMDGPGAIVRMWSPDPKGTLRIYIDNAETPALEAPMADLLSGKVNGFPTPFAESKSRGWNCYLPILYAKHCKVTSDKDGFYYQVNYRTYAPGTEVRSAGQDRPLTSAVTPAIVTAKMYFVGLQNKPKPATSELDDIALPGGGSRTIEVFTPDQVAKGQRAIDELRLVFRQLPSEARAAEALYRNLVISIEFDGERTVWCPVGDFFGVGVGGAELRDVYRTSVASGDMLCRWIMPIRTSCRITLLNLGTQPVNFAFGVSTRPWIWDARSMHFHAGWRQQYPIHTKKAAGTMDWNFVEITGGKGVYVGDNLTVVNPVADWWGEGDEKIYVDGEKFPSHFGTGTEDYYGYGWCCPDVFSAPFQSQVRCDGGKLEPKNNWGHTSLTRVRSLDAIPFKSSLKFDMEVWHWAECDIAYAATTYWYALPGVTSNRGESVDEVRRVIPEPPPLPLPFHIQGAAECESLKITARHPDGVRGDIPALVVERQAMAGFAKPGKEWSNNAHLWVKALSLGDWVELELPAADTKPKQLTLYATKSWDYATVRVSVDGRIFAQNLELCSRHEGLCEPTGPINLGTFTPVVGKDGKSKFTVRFEVVARDTSAQPPGTYFGLDCIVAADPK